MIQVTRLTHERVYVNVDLIETMEANPDTILTLIGGEKLIIQEPPDEVLERIASDGRGRRPSRPAQIAAVRPIAADADSGVTQREPKERA